MHKYDANTFVRGALLLAMAGFFSKVLSAGYRIPLQNLTGDVGFYMYQQVYPVLGMAAALALYGFPAAISKIAAERRTLGKSLSFVHFFGPAGLVLFVCNSVVFLLLWTQADVLAGWIGDHRLGPAYQLAAFIFLLLPCIALLRGWFQSQENMKPTAFSQIAEQLVRVGIIIAAAVWITKERVDLYHIASFASIAAIFGAVAAMFVLILFLQKNKKPTVATDAAKIEWAYYIRTILLFGTVQAMTHMVLLIIQFADTFTLLPDLMSHGFSKWEAMQEKGIFDRGQPLMQFGMVMGSSFALALVPNVARTRLQDNEASFAESIKTALSVGFYIAAGATIGLILLFPEINVLLYQNASGTNSLQLLMLSIVLSSLAITGASILQALGYIKQTAIFIIIAFGCKWAANHLFVVRWGITGSAMATVLALALLCLLVMSQLKYRIRGFSLVRQIRWQAFFSASLGMIGFIFLCKCMLPHMDILTRWQQCCILMPVILVGATLYMGILVKMRAFSRNELELLPIVSRFYRNKKD